ncbi:acyltransferase domain-containing protein [Streptomyces phyllanthi]|uniref:Acyltransferase n=1 Tax=Streptomyces phyllanthi TaxID=1803180 RepID=A0A5N8W8C4_9ACTN|nr:acyltransferase domain-containing protein [Streptomyces phyllanthi]MPY43372.1 acyltransferase [Streptomyces phyllanthi]
MLLDALRADEKLAEWLKEREGDDVPSVDTRLPPTDELPDLLLDLAVPYEDVNEVLALRRTLLADEEATRLLERCVGGLVRDMGEVGKGPYLPGFPLDSGPLGRYFHVYVFVAALPYVRAYHRERGVPDEVSRRTLADLGRGLVLHRRRYGVGGLVTPEWFALHFHGEMYQLGRLQFQRWRLGDGDVARFARVGLELRSGEPCLNLHIPDYRGPLSPEACDRSVALAREFFALHYPDERYESALCHSWLLDPQLKRRLPGDSNIVRFQERFEVVYVNSEPEDDLPIRFVFGDPELPVDTLPRRTSVERAVVDHLRAGGHWYAGRGWFSL